MSHNHEFVVYPTSFVSNTPNFVFHENETGHPDLDWITRKIEGRSPVTSKKKTFNSRLTGVGQVLYLVAGDEFHNSFLFYFVWKSEIFRHLFSW